MLFFPHVLLFLFLFEIKINEYLVLWNKKIYKNAERRYSFIQFYHAQGQIKLVAYFLIDLIDYILID